MADRADMVAAYIHAKDCNRPWLMRQTFLADARLEMVNRSEAISFPSNADGVDAISEILVEQFNRDNQNVYTVCLAAAPDGAGDSFSCNWLVAMSRRDTGEVRVGCGQYDWQFAPDRGLLVSSLRITIDVMEVLASRHSEPVLSWVSALPYPWCPIGKAEKGVPGLEELKPIIKFLNDQADS